MAQSKEIIDALMEVRFHDVPPPRPTFDKPDDETAFYTRNAFSAWDRALQLGRHDPALWEVIKGSPYESEYRRKFLSSSQFSNYR